jgi:hypothetical protein
VSVVDILVEISRNRHSSRRMNMTQEISHCFPCVHNSRDVCEHHILDCQRDTWLSPSPRFIF